MTAVKTASWRYLASLAMCWGGSTASSTLC